MVYIGPVLVAIVSYCLLLSVLAIKEDPKFKFGAPEVKMYLFGAVVTCCVPWVTGTILSFVYSSFMAGIRYGLPCD